MANFSVKEKDEASLLRECRAGFVECLHSPICRGLKAFLFCRELEPPPIAGVRFRIQYFNDSPSPLRWSLNRKPTQPFLSAFSQPPIGQKGLGNLKDQCMSKYRFVFNAVLVTAGVAFAFVSHSSTIAEDFALNPLSRGWQVFGETNLFQWNSTNQNLQVTWDSSQPNSYFHHPLGTILAKDDDFTLGFDLRLKDISIGVDTNKPYTFQIAIGLIHFADAVSTNFIRGSGFQSPNLAEFDYFPDSGFGATISPTLISSNNEYAYSFNIFELTTNDLYHVEMTYTASNHTLATMMTKNGASFGPIANAVVSTNFSDVRLDAVAISSYSDAGQDPMFAGSILAHGTVDNLVVTTPPLPVQNFVGGFSNNVWQASFTARTNWMYALERTADLSSWTGASLEVPGVTGPMVLSDTNAPAEKAFYRIRANRP